MVLLLQMGCLCSLPESFDLPSERAINILSTCARIGMAVVVVIGAAALLANWPVDGEKGLPDLPSPSC